LNVDLIWAMPATSTFLAFRLFGVRFGLAKISS
jgi:hypothetical protein